MNDWKVGMLHPPSKFHSSDGQSMLTHIVTGVRDNFDVSHLCISEKQGLGFDFELILRFLYKNKWYMESFVFYSPSSSEIWNTIFDRMREITKPKNYNIKVRR